MTLSRINKAGWGINDKFTSSQITQLDQQHIKATDNRTNGDNIRGNITLSGTHTMDVNSKITIAQGTVDANTPAQINVLGPATIDMSVSGASIDLHSAPMVFVTSASLTLPDDAAIHTTGTFTRDIVLGNDKFTYHTTEFVYNGVSLYNLASGAFIVEVPHHHNATLLSATVYFTPTSTGGHTSTPTYPSIAVYRVDPTTLTRVGLYSGTTSYYSPVSLADYDIAGVEQTMLSITQTMNQNHMLDNRSYQYHIYVHSEAGGGYIVGNEFYSIKLTYGNITSMSFQ